MTLLNSSADQAVEASVGTLPSYSTAPLGDNEYEDGELVPISSTTVLGRAVMFDPWLNFTPAQHAFWLNEISSPQVKFVGTVLSAARKQVELHIIYRNQAGETSYEEKFCITLPGFERFL